MIRILVLGMAVMAAHPSPLHLVAGNRVDRRVPQLEVLDWAALPRPAAFRPAMDPRLHAVHEVSGVARKYHGELLSLSRQRTKRLDRRAKRHPVVRRCGFRHPEVATDNLTRLGSHVLDERARA